MIDYMLFIMSLFEFIEERGNGGSSQNRRNDRDAGTVRERNKRNKRISSIN